MKMKSKILFTIIFLLNAGAVFAQGSAGYASSIEPQYIIDKPTAGVMGRHNLGLNFEFFQNGGILFTSTFGVFDKLDVGLSYGGYNLIGSSDDIKWNSLPGVKVKLRIFEEKYSMPAIVIGFESQGKEPYSSGDKRYTIKSPGFYAAASKNFKWLGWITYHLGFNYSLENDDDKDLNAYLGLEKTIGDDVSFNVEYDFGFNDNIRVRYGKDNGYLNVGLKWFVGNGVTLSLAGKNLLNNKVYEEAVTRIIGIELIQLF
jgi:hypothetical protein